MDTFGLRVLAKAASSSISCCGVKLVPQVLCFALLYGLTGNMDSSGKACDPEYIGLIWKLCIPAGAMVGSKGTN